MGSRLLDFIGLSPVFESNYLYIVSSKINYNVMRREEGKCSLDENAEELVDLVDINIKRDQYRSLLPSCTRLMMLSSMFFSSVFSSSSVAIFLVHLLFLSDSESLTLKIRLGRSI